MLIQVNHAKIMLINLLNPSVLNSNFSIQLQKINKKKTVNDLTISKLARDAV